MSTQKLHIDVETFSSVNIKTHGAYKYTESMDFEILMCAYAFNDEPIKMVDLANGESFPQEFIQAMQNDSIEKWAHNATFERLAFKQYGFEVPIPQWHCSAVKSAYCGLPLSLGDVSKALNLELEGKSSTGLALIKYFCVPIKSSKANGMRTRNMPHHNPEKWEEFKAYCKQDVRAERTIDTRLAHIIIPQTERLLYILDQQINDKGILIDLQLANNAVRISEKYTTECHNRTKEITGLENPNSPAQLKRWLSEQTQKNISSLAKEFIPGLIATSGSAAVKEVLELRVKTSKSSIKKYVAMLNFASTFDERARGLFQFYGGMRTGRWAGRAIQLQNLVRNYLKDLANARRLIKNGDYDICMLIYEDINEILSQLIRTGLIPKPGHTFAVVDFSAIEARVLAWLASEGWRLEVFNTHGKIYEASAARMYKKPLEDVSKEDRQKGKVAELALGYQGSVGAMVRMGGEAMGLTEDEMSEIVKKWRKENPEIVKLWALCDKLAKEAVVSKKHTNNPILKGVSFDCDETIFKINLPSGRHLSYQQPKISTNRKFNSTCIKYKGLDQERKIWCDIETYGGKLVENITQAIARDLLAHSMLKLQDRGFPMVMHVHDEIVCEVPIEGAEFMLHEMCEVLGEAVLWAKGLPLTADGYLTEFYKKD
jgi:DNA polymerase bacteriophage-type